MAAQRKINERRSQTPPRREVAAVILEKSRTLLRDCEASSREVLRRVASRARLLTGDAATTPAIAAGSVALVVTVTDAFCGGDRFTVSDGVTTLGTTSAVPVEGCPGTDIADPDLALANPAFSHGSFVVGAGSHSIGRLASFATLSALDNANF